MLTTNELIQKYIENFYTDYVFKDISIDDYILYGSIIKVNWSELRDNLSKLDYEYNTHRRKNTFEIDLLDYITFVSQLK